VCIDSSGLHTDPQCSWQIKFQRRIGEQNQGISLPKVDDARKQ